ncbi:hypothetical protein PsYK624_015560 [Phanerochaete sordida]|uniref:Uncharacterized protein n=1 Tax=Phanerochaete sordida TaxID=48140 RepID=A0A9P3FYC4_9APHY|nr:hypothetical protein PsYK624_015560 [Phanerochaete sordida]
MALPLPKAELIGTVLETVGFGAYVIVFIECLRLLCTRHRAGRDMRYLIATASVIFALAAVHLLIDIVRVMDAFTRHMDVPNSAAQFYGTITTPLNLAKSATYVAITLVLDALIVYRTYVVWGKRLLVVVLPSVLFVADIGLSAWATWSITEVRPGDDVMLANVTLRVKYFYSVTLALNLFCTLAIAGRIWSVHRGVTARSISGVRFTGVIAVILESAAIYSVLLVLLIATSAVGSTAMFVVLNSISPIIGMVFSAVIVRASREVHADTYMTTRMSFAPPSAPSFTDPFATRRSSAPAPWLAHPDDVASKHSSPRRASDWRRDWRCSERRGSDYQQSEYWQSNWGQDEWRRGSDARQSDRTARASLLSLKPSRASRRSMPWVLPPLDALEPEPEPPLPCAEVCDSPWDAARRVSLPSRGPSRGPSRIQVRVPTPAESVHVRVEMPVGCDEEEIEMEEVWGQEEKLEQKYGGESLV